MNKTTTTFLVLAVLVWASLPLSALACTIVSGIAPDGQVWNANNEDGPTGVANFINVFPRSESEKYGYFTLSYLSPEEGTGGNIQGGMNEAGLTFDFNALNYIEGVDLSDKKAFPEGDAAILPYILGNLGTVEEVISFFEDFWFQQGFRSAQMHVADRSGRFAIISASGIKRVQKGQSLVSTNFDICAGEDSSTCWRYPIAQAKLAENPVGLRTMMSIALETAPKNGAHRYTNIQNLTTGELWLFSPHDPNHIIETNITDLLAKGQVSFTFSDLPSLLQPRSEYLTPKYQTVILPDAIKEKYNGTYLNEAIGMIQVASQPTGLEILFPNGMKEVVKPLAEDRYVIPEANLRVEFDYDEAAQKWAMKVYEKDFWMFTSWQAE